MQTSVNLNMNPFFAGQIIDSRDRVIESHPADAAIGFGYGVVAGAGSDSVKLPTASTDVFRGVAAHNHKEQAYPTAAVLLVFLRYIASHFVMTYQYTLVQPCDYLRMLHQVWLYAQTSLVVQSRFLSQNFGVAHLTLALVVP